MRVDLVCELVCVDSTKALILCTHSGCKYTYHTLLACKAARVYTPAGQRTSHERVADPAVAGRQARQLTTAPSQKATGARGRVNKGLEAAHIAGVCQTTLHM